MDWIEIWFQIVISIVQCKGGYKLLNTCKEKEIDHNALYKLQFENQLLTFLAFFVH